jgi:hypothetical protein
MEYASGQVLYALRCILHQLQYLDFSNPRGSGVTRTDERERSAEKPEERDYTNLIHDLCGVIFGCGMFAVYVPFLSCLIKNIDTSYFQRSGVVPVHVHN